MEEREQANSLYVAMTRAEQALIIFSPAKPSGVAEWPMTAMQQLAARNDSDSESKTKSDSKTKNGALFFGDDLRGVADLQILPLPPPSKHLPRPPLGKSRPRTAAMMRGDMRHQILAMRLSGVAPALAKKLIAAEPSIWRQAETMLRSPPLKKLIAAAREILIERDFADGGKVIRPDLVLVGDSEVWIVDYKTGAAAPASHLPQLQSYRRAVSAVYPGKPVRTAILDVRGELHVLDDEDSDPDRLKIKSKKRPKLPRLSVGVFPNFCMDDASNDILIGRFLMGFQSAFKFAVVGKNVVPKAA